MKLKTTTIVRTEMASRYLQQLCKHFGHKTEVKFSPEVGEIKFDFGRTELIAKQGALTMSASADSAENLSRLQRVLASHLERFAFRESLQINWTS